MSEPRGPGGPFKCERCGLVHFGACREADITDRQRAALDRLWTLFGEPDEKMHYGIGYKGCARMVIQTVVFVVDRDTNRTSVEWCEPLRRRDFKDEMIWRDEHGLDGSYEGTRDSMLEGADHARKAAKENR